MIERFIMMFKFIYLVLQHIWVLMLIPIIFLSVLIALPIWLLTGFNLTYYLIDVSDRLGDKLGIERGDSDDGSHM